MKRPLLMSIFLFSFVLAFAQKSSISGFVFDMTTQESIIGANVFLVDRSFGISADQKGYFNLMVEVPAMVCVSCIGYADTCLTIAKVDDQPLQIKLRPKVQTLKSVEVNASRIDKLQFNTLSLAQKDIELLPAIGSCPDIIKAAQHLPGIEPLTEASSVMLVRGGNPGENLYMLDNVPLIYVNHVGGFMSVFNSEIINSMDVYKGGFPARFGDKLSSVVDLTARKGDPTKLRGALSAGLTDLAFSVEGPGGLENSSFIVTGRKTLAELLLYGLSEMSKNSGGQDYNIIYGFYDFDARYTWSPDAKNSFAFNIYEGDDYLDIWKHVKCNQLKEKNNVSNIWGNVLVSGHWYTAVSSRLFAANALSFTQYRLKKTQVLIVRVPLMLSTTVAKACRRSKTFPCARNGSIQLSKGGRWNMACKLPSCIISRIIISTPIRSLHLRKTFSTCLTMLFILITISRLGTWQKVLSACVLAAM